MLIQVWMGVVSMRFLGFLLIVGLLAGAGWWYWTTTPQYSIEQVKDAVKQHDLQKFNKYVDVDTASSHMVDDFLGNPMREALGPNMVAQLFVTGIMSIFKPAMAAGIKHEILTFVETGSFRSAADDGSNSGVSLANSDERLGFRKHAYKGITASTVEGGTARLELLLHNEKYNTDLPLDVVMRKMDGYWQVTELSNFPQFCGKLAQLEAQSPSNQHSDQSAPDSNDAQEKPATRI
jgi:hypothetical protein